MTDRTTENVNLITAAMEASGSKTIGDLVDYCRHHGTTPAALAHNTERTTHA